MSVLPAINRRQTVVVMILITMILMRLVWMQLRDHTLYADYRALVNYGYVLANQPDCFIKPSDSEAAGIDSFIKMKSLNKDGTYGWFVSPWFYFQKFQTCAHSSLISLKQVVKWNQWYLVVTVGAAALMVRFLTGSWIIGLIGAVVLFSRGSLLAALGNIGFQNFLVMIATLWLTCFVHFFKTGSTLSLAVGLVLGLVAGVYDPALLGLGMALPTMLLVGMLFKRYLAGPVLRRFREERRRIKMSLKIGTVKVYKGSLFGTLLIHGMQKYLLGQEPIQHPLPVPMGKMRGSWVLSTLNEPFALWAFHRSRWIKVVAACAAGMILSCLLVIAAKLGVMHWVGSSSSEVLKISLVPFQEWVKPWFAGLTEPMDIHLIICILLILFCALQSPAEGLKCFFETTWLTIFGFIWVTVFGMLFDWFDISVLLKLENLTGVWSTQVWGRSTSIMRWFEPIFLTLSIVCVYNLLLIINRADIMKP